MTVGARARILPDALQHNLARVRELAPGCRVMAAVKGNGYGHGLVKAAGCFEAADSLAVARLVEAETLRAAGFIQSLVLLGGANSADEMQRANDCDVELVIHSHAQLPLLADAGAWRRAWVKVDTGMHRLGFAPGESAAVVSQLRASGRVAELGLMTHLATADDPDDALGAEQARAFQALCQGFDGDVSIANSPAIFAGGSNEAWGNKGDIWVRPGIALYGISPFPTGSGADLGLRPAMQFESRLIDVKAAKRGARVGYGGRWQTGRDTVLGIVAAGYGDGYNRFLPSGTPVLVNGRRVPLAGTVSMDLAAVDLGPHANDRPGDAVLLWGDGLPVEEIARHAGTIPYQMVTGVLHREPPV